MIHSLPAEETEAQKSRSNLPGHSPLPMVIPSLVLGSLFSSGNHRALFPGKEAEARRENASTHCQLESGAGVSRLLVGRREGKGRITWSTTEMVLSPALAALHFR